MNFPLFVTGIARGGTNLIGRLLDAHPKVAIAIDPYLPLFRSLRNAIIGTRVQLTSSSTFASSLPLQDYYFTDERLQWMDEIQASELNVTFDRGESRELYERLVSRANLECPDLIPYLNNLTGETYRDLFNRGLDAIARARQAKNCQWIGLKDVWIVEFFAPLVRAYPQGKFIIILRDPRAVAASILGFRDIDPSQISHTLSFLRHWRKLVAFAWHYQNQPLFSNRLYVLTYEQLVRAPEQMARDLCSFLEIDYNEQMLDTDRYFDPARGETWKGNSTFVSTLSGIDPKAAERWRDKLDPNVTRVVEFVCGAEMQKLGYTLEVFQKEYRKYSRILEYLIENDHQDCSWRSDLGDLQQDYGFELFRRSLLDLPNIPDDLDLIRRSFLFEDVYCKLRE